IYGSDWRVLRPNGGVLLPNCKLLYRFACRHDPGGASETSLVLSTSLWSLHRHSRRALGVCGRADYRLVQTTHAQFAVEVALQNPKIATSERKRHKRNAILPDSRFFERFCGNSDYSGAACVIRIELFDAGHDRSTPTRS